MKKFQNEDFGLILGSIILLAQMYFNGVGYTLEILMAFIVAGTFWAYFNAKLKRWYSSDDKKN